MALHQRRYYNVSQAAEALGVSADWRYVAPDAATEAELRDLFAHAAVGIHWVGADGTILWANQAELDLLGYAAEEYVGRHVAEFHADQDAIADILRRLAGKETVQSYGARLRRKDGSIRHVLISSNVLWDGEAFVHTRCFTVDVTARALAEQRLAVQYAVTRALAEAATLSEAATPILRRIGETLGWEAGGLWSVDPTAGVLRCDQFWHSPAVDIGDFAPVSRQTTFAMGVGLPGRVWASGEPVWILDALADDNFPRGPHAVLAGLHAAFAFPIRLGRELLGVVEFFSRELRPPEPETLAMLAAVGGQIGQFIERTRAEAGLRERVQQAELAAEVGRALTSQEPLPRQLQRCAEALVAHLGAAFARVWTLDEDAQVLALQASAGCYTHLDGAHARVPVGAWKIGRIADERQPHLTNAVVGDPQVHDQEWARDEGMVAFAGYPLLVDDRVVGVMALFARRPLSESTLQALAAVADTVATGIVRKQAEEALAESERRVRDERATLATLNRVGRLLAGELDQGKLVQAVTDAATAVTGAQFGAFFYNVVDERGARYALYTLAGAPREAFAGFPMPRSTAVFGPTFRGEGVVRLADVRQDPRYGQTPPYHGLPPGHLPVASYLAVPVVARSGEVLGGLFFGHPEPGVFDTRAEALAVGLAAHAAVAVENARLHERAQSAEVRYRGVFAGVADAILVADGEGRYLDANPAAEALLDYAKDELLGLSVADVVAREPSWTEAEYARFVAEGRWRGELELRRKDGSLVPVEASATAVELPGGPVYLAAVRDVTERKRAEAERVAFLDAVAHDMKNPLGAAKGQAQLLRRRLQGGMTDLGRLAASLDGIEAAVASATALIDELLDAAHLRAGRPLELDLAPVDLVALAEAAAEETRRGTTRHTVWVDTEVPALVGEWDEARLRRVLGNLLGNAVKYSPEGGEIVVRLRREEDAGGSWAVLAVTDEGIGIPAADLPNLFDRFRRGSNVTGIGGTGIGLAGAGQIVAQHGGTIAVESVEGRGSTFTARLPLAEAASSPSR